MELKLERPLVFFDLETTGTDIQHDRIVEICLIKVFPDGHDEERHHRVNPQMHIPEGASKVHGIYDDDVKDCPTFEQLAVSLRDFMAGCDWAGYNSNRFDVPMLAEEFGRAGIHVDISRIKLVDVQNIFYKKEPRTLVAAYKFYCGGDLENAHSAMADTRATVDVLKAQLDRYDDLENNVGFLSAYTQMSRNVDIAGKIVIDEQNREVFSFGKYKGVPLTDVFRQNPGFVSWMMQADFPQNTKDVLQKRYFKYLHP